MTQTTDKELRSHDPDEIVTRARFSFEAGALARKTIINQIKLYLDANDIIYDIKTYGGFFSSAYLLTIHDAKVKHVAQIQDYLKEAATE